MQPKAVDTSSFTAEQKKAFDYANTLGTGVQTYATPSSIPVSSSGSTSPLNVPPPPQAPNYTGVASGAATGALTPAQTFTTPNGAVVDVNGNIITPAQQQTTPIKSITERMKSLLGSDATLEKPESLEDKYTQLTNSPDYLARKKEVDELTAQLAGLTAEADTIPLQAQEEAKGRGVTAAGLAPIEAGRARVNAIQQLPVIARLNAANGRLDSANQNIQTLLQLQEADQKAETDYKTTLYNRALTIASAEQAEEIRLLQEKNDIKKNADTEFFATRRGFANAAIQNGDYALAAKIASAPDMGTVRGLVGGLSIAPQDELLSISDAKALGVPYGTTRQQAINMGVVPGMTANGSSYKTDLATTGIQAVNGLLDIAVRNPSIFGRTAALPLPDAVRTDAFRNYEAQLDFLKGNIIPAALAAMREASKTGGAVGQVSDREGAWLASSLGALSMNQSPEAVQKQLVEVKRRLQNWVDVVQTYGGPQTISGQTVTAPDGSQIIITD